MPTEEPAGGQAPTTPSAPTGQVPAAAKTNGEAAGEQMFPATLVAELRAEAAASRVKANEALAKLETLTQEKATAETKKAEEQGEFQNLYQQAQTALATATAEHTAALDRAKSRVLDSKLRSALVGQGGLPQALVKNLQLSTDGLTVGDDWEITGDLDAAVKKVTDELGGIIKPAPTAPATPTKPATQPAINIGERPSAPEASAKVTRENVGAEFTRRLRGDAT